MGIRDTIKYDLVVDAVVYRGVTSALQRREAEHHVLCSNGHEGQVGRRTTRAHAVTWAAKYGRQSPGSASYGERLG